MYEGARAIDKFNENNFKIWKSKLEMGLANANNTKEDNDYTCATQHEAYPKVMYKWIVDLGIAKHMTSYMTTFNTHEVIAPFNIYLDDDNAVKMIKMDSIVVEV